MNYRNHVNEKFLKKIFDRIFFANCRLETVWNFNNFKCFCKIFQSQKIVYLYYVVTILIKFRLQRKFDVCEMLKETFVITMYAIFCWVWFMRNFSL